MDIRRPDVLTLRVRDVEASLRFFHDVLGLPVKLRADRYAELQTETTLLTLVERPRLGEDTPPGTADSPSLGWEVDDLEAAAAELRAKGVTLTPSPASHDAEGLRGRRLAFRDPDGHVFELIAFAR